MPWSSIVMVFRVWQSYLWNRTKCCGWQRLQHKLRHTPLPIELGSAGKAMPGFDVRIVNNDGNELQPGSMGNIVMATLAPTAFTTLWNDENRSYRSCLRRFNGKWIDTGDAGMIDRGGYISIMSRSDDIINVAAHRFSTGKLSETTRF